jgi:uncharacterized protein YjbJ (UPF0337 family)
LGSRARKLEAVGKAKEKWCQPTNHDIAQIEQLGGEIQPVTATPKDKVKSDVDDWADGL